MASALIQFAQGSNTDLPGRAVIGDMVSGTVTVSNGDNTGIVSWKYELLYVPPGSTIPLTVQGPSGVSTFTFPQPDTAGSYRVRMTTTDTAGGTDVDIRNLCVKLPHGLIAPPYQGNPPPLPLTGAGAKPNEMNIGGQPNGWDGDANTTRPLLYQLIGIVDSLNGGGTVPATRQINTTSPLVGGGTLAADLTLSLSAGSAGAVMMTLGGLAGWASQGNIVHSNLGGLSADDHPQYLRTDGTRALTGPLSAGGFNLTNGATPVNPTDFTIKSYVDGLVQGIKKQLEALVLISSNVALSGAPGVVDGYTPPNGAVALCTGQTNAVQNGLWVINNSGAWTRPTNFPTGGSAAATFVFIQEGTVYVGTGWICTAVPG